jgi:hypothetical protein
MGSEKRAWHHDSFSWKAKNHPDGSGPVVTEGTTETRGSATEDNNLLFSY